MLARAPVPAVVLTADYISHVRGGRGVPAASPLNAKQRPRQQRKEQQQQQQPQQNQGGGLQENVAEGPGQRWQLQHPLQYRQGGAETPQVEVQVLRLNFARPASASC